MNKPAKLDVVNRLAALRLAPIICSCCLFTAAVPAQNAAIAIDAALKGPRIGSMHYGIFFEEINHGGEGGLWAELLPNRSFENGTPTEGWAKLAPGGAAGTLTTDTSNPLNSWNQTELAVNVSTVGAVKSAGAAAPDEGKKSGPPSVSEKRTAHSQVGKKGEPSNILPTLLHPRGEARKISTRRPSQPDSRPPHT